MFSLSICGLSCIPAHAIVLIYLEVAYASFTAVGSYDSAW